MGFDHNHTENFRPRLTALNEELAQDLIPVMVYIGFLMLLGFVGNLVVCFIFSFRMRMDTQHFLIVCLAVFDLLSCFIAMPTEIVDLRYFLMFDNEFACRMLRFLNSYCAFASVFTLFVIAVDRYMKVCRPFKNQMALHHTKVALVIVLLAALTFSFPAPILFGIRTTGIDNTDLHGHDCATNDKVIDTVYPLAYNTILFLGFIILLVLLTIIYIKIWREMRRHNLYMARNSDANISRYLSSMSESNDIPLKGTAKGVIPGISVITEDPNDEVFTDAGQQPASERPAGETTISVPKGGGCSCEEGGGMVHKCPSIQSDITYCGSEPDEQDPCDQEHDESVRTDQQESAIIQDATDVTFALDSPDADNSFTNTDEGLNSETLAGTSSTDVQVDEGIHDCDDRERKEGRDIRNEDDEESRSKTQPLESVDAESHVTQTNTVAENIQEDEESFSRQESDKQNSLPGFCGETDETADALANQHNARDTTPDIQAGPASGTNDIAADDSVNANMSYLAPASRSKLSVRISANSTTTVSSTDEQTWQPEKTNGESIRLGVEKRKIINQKARKSQMKTYKATMIATSVTVVFFLSFLPYLSLLTARIIDTDLDRDLRGAALVFYNIFLRSYFINSVSNPIIYGVQNARFRAECMRLLREFVSCKKQMPIVSDA